jgi:hypothetical protein
MSESMNIKVSAMGAACCASAKGLEPGSKEWWKFIHLTRKHGLPEDEFNQLKPAWEALLEGLSDE